MSSNTKIRKLVTLSTVDVAQALQSLKVPGKVVTANLSTGWTEVGRGNILRIQVAADTYVAFTDIEGDSSSVSVTTSPAVKLPAGDHYVLCQAKFVRASANPTRVELLEL
jgi:uncharacterized protein (DUF2237 family)